MFFGGQTNDDSIFSPNAVIVWIKKYFYKIIAVVIWESKRTAKGNCCTKIVFRNNDMKSGYFSIYKLRLVFYYSKNFVKQFSSQHEEIRKFDLTGWIPSLLWENRAIRMLEFECLVWIVCFACSVTRHKLLELWFWVNLSHWNSFHCTVFEK